MPQSKRNRTIRVAVGILVLILIGYLRETGRANLNLYQAESGNSSVLSESSHSSGDDPPIRSASAMGQPAARIVKASGDAALVRLVQESIASVPGSKPPLQIAIRNLHTRGPYFFPLYKNGDCAYEILISDGNPEAVEDTGANKNVHYRATLTGEIHETVKGVCSGYHFQELVGQDIAKQVRHVLEKYESEPPPKK